MAEKAKTVDRDHAKTERLVWYGFVAILVGLPFHAFLITWIGSFAPANLVTLLRYWKELILFAMTVATLTLVFQRSTLRRRLISDRFALAFILLTFLHGIILVAFGAQLLSGLLAFKINLGFLALYLILSLTQIHSKIRDVTLYKLILIPAGLAGAFGVLQAFILPRGFLTYFGYGPYGGINPAYSLIENSDTIRVMGTLWGPNQYGSYLVLPVALSFWLLFKGIGKQKIWASLVFIIDMLALYVSHSRGAWLAVAFSLIVIVALIAQGKIRWILVTISLGIMVAIIALAINQKLPAQVNIILLHGDVTPGKTGYISSNYGHERALELGINRLNMHPFGDGLESAGRASENSTEKLYTENFFLQLAVQVGYPGLLLFIFISIVTAWRLTYNIGIDPLNLPLLASFVGLSINNLVAHTWSDGATSWIWWGMAGILLARSISRLGTKNA